MLNTPPGRKIGLLAALIAAQTGADALTGAMRIKTRGQRGMRDIIGPATNWPSGKTHRKPRGDSGQRPKFAKERKHKQHTHLKDGTGQAFTLVGRMPLSTERRTWLAGISAQRGY